MQRFGALEVAMRQYTLFCFINLSAKWVAFAGQKENRRSSSCLMPRSAEQEPHAQQNRKENQVGQGE